MDLSAGPLGAVLVRLGMVGPPGAGLLVLDLAATLVLAVVLLVGTVSPAALGVVVAGWAAVLFVAGCVLFLWALAIAAQRSRRELIGVGGLFFLVDAAPRPVRVRFLSMLAAQCVLSLAAAAARPFTVLAFGVLAPMFGLGVEGLWAARHGRFPPRG